MTSAEDEVTLASLAERLDALVDLFRRRLLDDRAKQAVIEDLQGRLTEAERALAADSLRPIVAGLALAIERVQSADPSADLRSSIVEELEDVLESLGVTAIPAIPGSLVDRLRHEVASATGEGTELRVEKLLREGYEKDGVVLRPAKVAAIREPVEAVQGRSSWSLE